MDVCGSSDDTHATMVLIAGIVDLVGQCFFRPRSTIPMTRADVM